MKIAHISDVHIRNLKYHKEYKEIFNQLYDILKKEKPDIIVNCGDTNHTKISLSPESVSLISEFLLNLSNIAPLYVILGNHDGLTKNVSRLDAISPIVKALNKSNIYLLKTSQEIQLNDKFVLNSLSIYDKDNWIMVPTNLNKINIALYHGSVSGCKTDTGWEMEYGDVDISVFENFDYVMMGDIHKTNQILDDKGKARYVGSLSQQNHGETNDKGFLIWEIESKEKFTVRHISIPNPKPFVTIELTPKGRVPKQLDNISLGSRIRIVSNNQISFDKIKRAIDVTKQRFKPESVTFLNRSIASNTIGELEERTIQENLRDVSVQEELISNFLKEYDVEKEILNKIFELNKRYNSFLNDEEEIIRNVRWELKNLKWNYLFNYGKGNEIDFSNTHGTVGIFGKNYTGKSNSIQILLFTIYNSISKKSGKHVNIINQNKNWGDSEVEIIIGDETYKIERRLEKYEKKLYGQTTIEATTSVNFYKINNYTGEKTDLNGESRIDTDKKIRKIFGTMDDFLLASMSSQFGSLSFINEGSTKRKEILAKFLDLDIFEKKFKLAKEEAANSRGALKLLEGRNFDEEIASAEREFNQSGQNLTVQKRKCEGLKNDAKKKNEEIINLQNKIDSIPAEIIDIKQVEEELRRNKDLLARVKGENKDYFTSLKEDRDKKKKIEHFLNTIFDIKQYREKKKQIQEKRNELQSLISDIKYNEKIYEETKKRTSLLDEVPCGDNYPNCKLLDSAHKAFKKAIEISKMVDKLIQKRDNIEKVIEEIEPEQVESYLEKHDRLLDRKNELISKISKKELKIQTNKNRILSYEHKIFDLEDKRQEYEDNKEIIENLEHIVAEKREKEKELNRLNKLLNECEEEILLFSEKRGSFEQKLTNLKEKKEELLDLRKQYEVYDLYMKSVHSNGIAYEIIKRKLPVINDEISKILANITSFQVFFETDERNLKILIKHLKYDARPLEIGSGAENSLAATTIRLALLKISTLPQSDTFIMDEPATELDSDNLMNFSNILDLIKSSFKNVIIISHLEELKDSVDSQIVVEKDKKGYAHINYKEN